ncbi:MAG: DmsC/YnfH family molybdoenzyme membrane anchor subunit [Pirellulaceae bacterium]|nr:DmsC/YnfH family molybdoenzyme membrane anchor subunit [Pirellulaceae bacterium]
MTYSLVDALLDEQQTLTAVQEFSQRHESGELTASARVYRDLIPVGAPGELQQFAFEVDLDSCSGCKACVAACHNLNGLEPGETWRSVGQLVGGSTTLPVIQHVTTACHHCLEPACLSGCPVKAYEKDPATGIVRHLDDQCIGCQYCTLTCPYEVPVYSHKKGIVRKCDMCHQRLAVGEAPACVQFCPNQAIRIRIVDVDQVREDAETHNFLPGAPEPSLTLPTTTYKSSKPMPKNLLPADYFRVHRQHGHMPLVWMLVLTQMSAGAFVVEQWLYHFWLGSNLNLFTTDEGSPSIGRLIHLAAAMVCGGLGLTVGTLHLGRPFYAFRAILGLRTSWLSREMLSFGVFATVAAAYVAVATTTSFQLDDKLGFELSDRVAQSLGLLASVSGLVAVMTSVMIYVATRRPMWTFGSTTAKFLLTSALLGLPTAMLILLAVTFVDDPTSVANQMHLFGDATCRLTILVTAIKLATELSFLFHLHHPQMTAQKRAAQLLVGELSMVVVKRFFFGVVGGIALPGLLLSEAWIAGNGYHPLFVMATAALSLVLLFIGELHERYLFFTASVSPRMPGVPN